MAKVPVNGEIAAALGKFFFRGSGPSHSTLTRVFTGSGYGGDDPYDLSLGTPTKEQRVLTVVGAAIRRPAGAQRLVEELLTALRMHGCFSDDEFDEHVKRLTSVFARQGWELDSDGYLTVIGTIDLETGGRAALDELLSRLQRNIEDPGALLGGAKELLESISKFVLEERMMLPDRKVDFDEALTLALTQLQLLPTLVNADVPGGKQVRAIYQSAKTTASTINELRNLQGTGHGRTLPTGVGLEVGRYVIREATHVAELMLATHDRQMGRGA